MTQSPFLQMGTKPNKNLARVIESLQGLSIHLRIVGKLDSHQATQLPTSGLDYSNVANLSDEQVVAEYQRCDLLLFASTFEGFGLPIVEAQATGRPVVTSNVWSMPEVGGDAVCLVDPLDVASIRAGVLRVIGNAQYRMQLVRLGFENVKRYRRDRIASIYACIYHELVNGLGT